MTTSFLKNRIFILDDIILSTTLLLIESEMILDNALFVQEQKISISSASSLNSYINNSLNLQLQVNLTYEILNR